jgi:hypothetical protein
LAARTCLLLLQHLLLQLLLQWLTALRLLLSTPQLVQLLHCQADVLA